MNDKDKISVGNAGEYFVAGELERRGFTCAVPMSNTKDFDILAISRKTFKQYAIQVKTSFFTTRQWPLHKKNEKLIGKNIFYVFVSMNGLESPDYYIVPSRIVAKTITERHQEWLATPGRAGRKHQDTTIRNFMNPDQKYLNRWDYLE